MPTVCTYYYVTSCYFQLYACGCGGPRDWSPAWPLPRLAGGAHPADWGPQLALIATVRGAGHAQDLVGTPGPVPARVRGAAHPADTITEGRSLLAFVRGGAHPADTVRTGGSTNVCSGCVTPPNTLKTISVAITGPTGSLAGTWTLRPVAGQWQASSGFLLVRAVCTVGQLLLTIGCAGGGLLEDVPPDFVDCTLLMAAYTLVIPSAFGCGVSAGSYSAVLTWQA